MFILWLALARASGGCPLSPLEQGSRVWGVSGLGSGPNSRTEQNRDISNSLPFASPRASADSTLCHSCPHTSAPYQSHAGPQNQPTPHGVRDICLENRNKRQWLDPGQRQAPRLRRFCIASLRLNSPPQPTAPRSPPPQSSPPRSPPPQSSPPGSPPAGYVGSVHSDVSLIDLVPLRWVLVAPRRVGY